MRVRRHNVLSACVSVLGALALLVLFLKSLDRPPVWAAPLPALRSGAARGLPSAAGSPALALEVPALLFPDDGTATNEPDVSFGWSDVGAATYTLRVGAAEYTTMDTTKRLDLADGVYTWTVQAVDAFGIPSGFAVPWTVTVDTTPPSTPVLISPDDGAASDSVDIRFSWSSVDGAAFYHLRVDDEAPRTAITTSMLVSNLAEGAHEWAVEAADEVGNVSGYTISRTVTVDTVRPTATLVEPIEGTVLTTTHLHTVTIRGTAFDADAGLDRVEVNTGAGWTRANGTENWAYTWPLPLLDNELQELRVRALDRAGNQSDQPQAFVVVDTRAPTASPPLPDPPREWVTRTVAYDWLPSEDGSGIARYRIHIYTMQGYSETFESADPGYIFRDATQEGEGYFAQVQALDGRGNWGPWSTFSTVVPDLTPPTVWDPYILVDHPKLYAVGTMLYYNNTIDVSQIFRVGGHAEDVLSGVKQVCFTPAFGDRPLCYSPQPGLSEWRSGDSTDPDDHDYTVDPGARASGVVTATVYDKAGNVVHQTYSYELDETPPESAASAATYATTAPVHVGRTADDTQSGVRWVELWYRYGITGTWTYDQKQPEGEDSFEFLPPDGSGMYYFTTVAEDRVGNREAGVAEPDTQTLYDTSKPTSQVTWAPAYWNKPDAPISVTWVATPSLPGNPVIRVRLWYRFNAGDWVDTNIAGSGMSGEFDFYPPLGDGTYDLETVAEDESGKSEALPFGSGDRTVVYDTAIGALGGLSCHPSGWSSVNSFATRWTNPGDLSGIAAAYYKVGAAPTGPLDGTRKAGGNLQQIPGIVLPGEGQHTVWVWLEDNAGNVDHTRARNTFCKYDASVGAPSGVAVSPPGWTATDAFTVTWSNPGDLSGIAGAYWKLDGPPADAEDGTRVPGVQLGRISGITVGNEGAHSLYLWLYDAAGNIGVSERQTVSLLYDPTPPTDVLISTPVSMTKASFEVYWTADAAASGLMHYTVEYSRVTDTVWQPWLTATKAISGLFVAPLAGTDYAFRVTVYDRAGNVARAHTSAFLELQRAYLPVFSDRWAEWYLYDTFEPNDTWQDAYGPLKIGHTYHSSVWNQEDLNDWYHFTVLTGSRVKIYLDGIPKNKDYDLYVYGLDKRAPLHKSDQYESSNEEIRFWPTPGAKYWILVRPYQGPKPPPPPNNYSPEFYSLTLSIID